MLEAHKEALILKESYEQELKKVQRRRPRNKKKILKKREKKKGAR